MDTFSKRQKEIIDTAIELIAQHGIQELTIKNLSRKIGIAESAIYRHFSSKMDILVGILTLFRINEQRMNQALAGITDNPREKMKQMFLKRFHFLKQNRAIASVIFSEELFRNDRRLSEQIYDIMRTNKSILIDLIQEGQAKGIFRQDIKPEPMTFMMMGGMRLIVNQWRFSGYAFDLYDKGLEFWQTVETLLKKP